MTKRDIIGVIFAWTLKRSPNPCARFIQTFICAWLVLSTMPTTWIRLRQSWRSAIRFGGWYLTHKERA